MRDDDQVDWTFSEAPAAEDRPPRCFHAEIMRLSCRTHPLPGLILSIENKMVSKRCRRRQAERTSVHPLPKNIGRETMGEAKAWIDQQRLERPGHYHIASEDEFDACA